MTEEPSEVAHPLGAAPSDPNPGAGPKDTRSEQTSGGLNLTVGAVARRLGVAPATLRTWARRYGLGPSAHVAGAHRRYSPQDLARLDLMRRMVDAGVGPGDAARAAKAATTGMLVPAGTERQVEPDDRAQAEVTRHAATPSEPPATDVPTGVTGTRGGYVLGRPGTGPAVRGLARAVLALDGPGSLDLIVSCLASRGVAWTWDELLVPVLVDVGTRCETTGEGIEAEHLLTTAATTAFASVVLRTRDRQDLRPALLACAEEEQHALPLWAAAAALAECHVSVRVLGARVPRSTLVAAIRRIGPCATLVWSSLRETGDLAALAELPRLRPAPLLLVGGPGWHGTAPEGIERSRSLRDAVDRIYQVAV